MGTLRTQTCSQRVTGLLALDKDNTMKTSFAGHQKVGLRSLVRTLTRTMITWPVPTLTCNWPNNDALVFFVKEFPKYVVLSSISEYYMTCTKMYYSSDQVFYKGIYHCRSNCWKKELDRLLTREKNQLRPLDSCSLLSQIYERRF